MEHVACIQNFCWEATKEETTRKTGADGRMPLYLQRQRGIRWIGSQNSPRNCVAEGGRNDLVTMCHLLHIGPQV